MSEHLPDCFISQPWDATTNPQICICDRLRATEQRVRDKLEASVLDGTGVLYGERIWSAPDHVAAVAAARAELYSDAEVEEYNQKHFEKGRREGKEQGQRDEREKVKPLEAAVLHVAAECARKQGMTEEWSTERVDSVLRYWSQHLKGALDNYRAAIKGDAS
jgi:flagellar biosynthesis/type III secretory pathway protein FliH